MTNALLYGMTVSYEGFGGDHKKSTIYRVIVYLIYKMRRTTYVNSLCQQSDLLLCALFLDPAIGS